MSHHCSRCPNFSRCPVPEACQLADDGGVEMAGRLFIYAIAIVGLVVLGVFL